MDIASRRVGRRMEVGAGSTVRAIFGPFDLGERVEGLYVAIAGATLVATIEIVLADIRAFTTLPGDSASEFALGRPLCGDGIAGSLPQLPLVAGRFRLPINWWATNAERYLGLQLTSPGAQGIIGCVFVCTYFGGGSDESP